jgi:hypothetical protein
MNTLMHSKINEFMGSLKSRSVVKARWLCLLYKALNVMPWSAQGSQSDASAMFLDFLSSRTTVSQINFYPL